MRPANLPLIWAEWLIDTLVRAGVREAVISPGSRSTPLTLAAAQHPQLTCYPIIDERSAGFFALGLARAQRRAPLLICTSGTAGAHYYPAIIEALAAHHPLLVLTADRPPELQQRGAAQTIDQRQLYASQVKRSYDLGTPSDEEQAWRGLRATARRAVLEAQAEPAGPVHLNAPLRKPLEPQLENALDQALRQRLQTLKPVSDLPDLVGEVRIVDLDGLAGKLATATRGVIAAGPNDQPFDDGVARLADRLGWPLLADTTSQLRRPSIAAGGDLIAHHELILQTGAAATLEPDVVLVVGAEPGGLGWSQWSSRLTNSRWICLAPARWPDPANRIGQWVTADITSTVHLLIDLLPERGTTESSWRDRWIAADQAARLLTTARVDPEAPLLESSVTRIVVEALDASEWLMLGNSLPVRDVDLFAPPCAAERILHQRGVNGIDGLIAGVAAAPTATTLLLGDVSFAHDIGSLATLAHSTARKTIVVIDNGGGRIFDQLPLADRSARADLFTRYFRTPPQLDPVLACAAFGISATRVRTAAALSAALEHSRAQPAAVIWADVVPDSARTVLRERVEQLDQLLAE